MDNGLWGFILQWVSDRPYSLAAVTAFLLLLLAGLHAKSKRPGNWQRRLPVAGSKPAVSAPAIAGDDSRPEAAPQSILEAPTRNSIEVAEADPLAEAVVYLEFGYLDHAAQTLRQYVDGPGSGNREVLRKLLQIYLQLGRIDEYADILERLWNAAEDQDFVQTAILDGLAVDVDNLHLRVVAESCLGLGPEQLRKLLGSDAVLVEEQQLDVGPESLPPMPAQVTESGSVQPSKSSGDRPLRLVQHLIRGGMRLPSSFSQEEKAMLSVFTHPVHEARLHRSEARLHIASGDLDAAEGALRRAIAARPLALVNFADLLWVLHRRKLLDEYAITLWRLYCVLNGAGRALRERFLGMGFALGQHQVLESLLQATDRRQLEEIGRQFCLLPAEKATSRKLQLVDVSRQEKESWPTDSPSDVLDEVNAYLEFGQIDQAIEILESAIINDPSDVRFYPTLLDIYDRMDELDRFIALSVKVKKLVQRPPEEVVPMMLSLQQRLQQRKQRGRRARE